MTEIARYRAMLGDVELLLYASAKSREPLRLPPNQVARLHRLLDEIEHEKVGTGAAWRVDRTTYRTKTA